MDKIKSFFQSKITKVVSWVVLIIAAVLLIVGGATSESISSAIAMVDGIVLSMSALIAFISGKVK